MNAAEYLTQLIERRREELRQEKARLTQSRRDLKQLVSVWPYLPGWKQREIFILAMWLYYRRRVVREIEDAALALAAWLHFPKGGRSVRAAIYTRVSTSEQATEGYSLKTQQEVCQAYAATHGFTVVQVLTDDCSGAIPIGNRPEGKRLYDLARSRSIEAVIVLTQDRLSRSDRQSELVMFWDTLEQNGVRLHFTDTGEEIAGLEGDLLRTIRGHVAATERRKIGERSATQRRARAKDGQLILSGRVPYGYKKTGKGRESRLEIDELTARTVRDIYNWYLAGESMETISQRLDQAGVPPPGKEFKGEPSWRRDAVYDILRSTAYAGVFTYGKRRWVRYDTEPGTARGKGKIGHHVEGEEILIDKPELVIIDRETWEAAQQQMEHNRRFSKRNGKHDYLLSGRVRCGACGRAMTGVFRGKTRRYVCVSNSKRNAECTRKNETFPADRVEAGLWQIVSQVFLNDAVLEEMFTTVRERMRTEYDQVQVQMTQLDRLITRADRQLENLAGDLAAMEDTSPIARDLIRNQIKQAARQREALAEERAGLESSLHPLLAEEEDQIKRTVREMRAGLENPSHEARRAALDFLNVTVVWSAGHEFEIYLDFPRYWWHTVDLQSTELPTKAETGRGEARA